MDAFLTRLSYHATSYAVRSCIALTSTYILKQGTELLKAVEHDEPLRAEISRMHRRLGRKIELVSPILESIELRYTRGDSALETVVQVARGLREDIDTLSGRLKHAASTQVPAPNGARLSKTEAAQQRAELLEIIDDIKNLITSIDDAIPLINLWVSAIGGIQAPPSSFSPSRLLQASMLVNVGDTQFILNPGQPMQIGPNFTLSLYMLFRGHASAHGSQEPYGIEEGQRKPMWQEVIHKARVRLLRVPSHNSSNGIGSAGSSMRYSYQLQVVEDLDDGRMHSFEDTDLGPTPFDGLSLAGIREFLPIHQISKMFYADVGKILNINNDDGASNSPVLLLKRDINAVPVAPETGRPVLTIESPEGNTVCETPRSETNPQGDVDFQLRQEMRSADKSASSTIISSRAFERRSKRQSWNIPADLDPEWMALEVLDIDEDENSGSDSDSDSVEKDSPRYEEDVAGSVRGCRPRHTARPAVDQNLVTQLNRMNIASSSSSRPSLSESSAHQLITQKGSNARNGISTPSRNGKSGLLHHRHHQHNQVNLSPTKLIERSPFGAIKTSLSLLEMLLRLTSLQEFEQTTHLAIPDHVLKFYLDESVSTSGLHGKDRLAASAEAERKVGFDPYADQTT